MISSSFKTSVEIFTSPATLFPKEFSIEGYKLLFRMTNFGVYIRNSFIVSTIASFSAICFSVGAIYGITRFNFIGAKTFTYLSLMVYMIPPILFAIPLYTLWIKFNLTDSLVSLTISYIFLTLPFALWMNKSYFGTLSRSMEEAAMVDGATRFRAFLVVMVPQAMPGLIATLIFTFILSWNEYVITLVIISSQRNSTVALGVANLIGESAMYSWSMVNAAGVIACLPILILFIFIQRHLVSGMSVGALTGQ